MKAEKSLFQRRINWKRNWKGLLQTNFTWYSLPTAVILPLARLLPSEILLGQQRFGERREFGRPAPKPTQAPADAGAKTHAKSQQAYTCWLFILPVVNISSFLFLLQRSSADERKPDKLAGPSCRSPDDRSFCTPTWSRRPSRRPSASLRC